MFLRCVFLQVFIYTKINSGSCVAKDDLESVVPPVFLVPRLQELGDQTPVSMLWWQVLCQMFHSPTTFSGYKGYFIVYFSKS